MLSKLYRRLNLRSAGQVMVSRALLAVGAVCDSGPSSRLLLQFPLLPYGMGGGLTAPALSLPGRGLYWRLVEQNRFSRLPPGLIVLGMGDTQILPQKEFAVRKMLAAPALSGERTAKLYAASMRYF